MEKKKDATPQSNLKFAGKSGPENYSVVKTKSMFYLLKAEDNSDQNNGDYAIGCAGVVLMDDMDYQGAQRAWKQITPILIAAVQAAVIINHLTNKGNGK